MPSPPPPSHPGYLSRPAHQVLPEDIQCVYESSDGQGAIFLGNLQAAQNIHTLKKHKIGSVLTSCKNIHIKHPKEYVPFALYIPGEDHPNYDLSVHFETATDFISQSRKETNILVHCMAGISRSTTLVLAYLMRFKGLTLQQAFHGVSSRRKKVNPNSGFMKQLQRYEKELPSKFSSKPTHSTYDRQNMGSSLGSIPRRPSSQKHPSHHNRSHYESSQQHDKYEKFFSREKDSKKYNPEYEPTLGVSLNYSYNIDKLYQNPSRQSYGESRMNRPTLPLENSTNYATTSKNTYNYDSFVPQPNSIEDLGKSLDDRINKIKQKYYERSNFDEKRIDPSKIDRLSIGLDLSRDRGLENRDVLRSSLFKPRDYKQQHSDYKEYRDLKSRPATHHYGSFF